MDRGCQFSSIDTLCFLLLTLEMHLMPELWSAKGHSNATGLLEADGAVVCKGDVDCVVGAGGHRVHWDLHNLDLLLLILHFSFEEVSHPFLCKNSSNT